MVRLLRSQLYAACCKTGCVRSVSQVQKFLNLTSAVSNDLVFTCLSDGVDIREGSECREIHLCLKSYI